MRLAALTLAAALAACSTGQYDRRDPKGLSGCWFQQQSPGWKDMITQRWFLRDDGVWQGSEMPPMEPPSAQVLQVPRTWELRRTRSGFELCELDPIRLLDKPTFCRNAFFGRGHAVGDEPDWWEFDVGAERLHITYVTPQYRSATFDGHRWDCH